MNRLIREVNGTPESHPLTFNEFATNAEVFGLVEKVQTILKEEDLDEHEDFPIRMNIDGYWKGRINMHKEENLPVDRSHWQFDSNEAYGYHWLCCDTEETATKWAHWLKNLMRVRPRTKQAWPRKPSLPKIW
jgi:hypothetical protein